MVENGGKWWKNGEILFFLKNGEMVKNGDLNSKNFSHKYFISSLEYISMIVYTNVENHLFSSLYIIYTAWNSFCKYLLSIPGALKTGARQIVVTK